VSCDFGLRSVQQGLKIARPEEAVGAEVDTPAEVEVEAEAEAEAAWGTYLSGWVGRRPGWRSLVAPPHRVARWTGGWTGDGSLG